jgi:hypothetical protein
MIERRKIDTELFPAIVHGNQDEEVKHMIGAVSFAQQQQADKQLAVVFSSLQLPLNKLYTKELFWVLSSREGDEGNIDLDVSHPGEPSRLRLASIWKTVV